jgi:hypothetical protein
MAHDGWHDVPEAWRVDAERVRRHLVALRGGAPFLSSEDAERLLGWLEAGRSISPLLVALEQAAEQRRRRRARTPLSLRHVKSALGRPPASVAAAPTASDGLALRQRLEALQRDPSLAAVAVAALRALSSVRSPEEIVDIASRFWEDGWSSLGEGRRHAWREEAGRVLSGVLDALDDAARDAVLEEHARATWRASMPELSIQVWLEASP